jgi:hypothetical protein
VEKSMLASLLLYSREQTVEKD